MPYNDDNELDYDPTDAVSWLAHLCILEASSVTEAKADFLKTFRMWNTGYDEEQALEMFEQELTDFRKSGDVIVVL